MRLHKNCATNLGITEHYSVQLQWGEKSRCSKTSGPLFPNICSLVIKSPFPLLFHNVNCVSFGALAERSQASPMNGKHARLCSKAL